MFCGTDNILQNVPHIQVKCGKYSIEYLECGGIFHIILSVPQNIAMGLNNVMLSFSLDVNQMWTKRNDHAPKNECVHFLNICPKGVDFLLFYFILEFDHSIVFSCLCLLLPPIICIYIYISLKFYYNNIVSYGALVFFYQSIYFASPLQNPLDHVSG